MDSDLIEKYQSLKQYTFQLKMKLAEILANCQDLIKGISESSVTAYYPNISGGGDSRKIHTQLRDVLESNQQRVFYDHQKEEYIKRLWAMIYQLEQQLEQANSALQDKNRQASLEVMQPWEIQQGYRAQENKVKDLEQLKQWWTKMQLEAANAEKKMLAELNVKQRRCWEKQLTSLRSKLNITSIQLKEEKLKTSELQEQVNHLKFLLNKDNPENSTDSESLDSDSDSYPTSTSGAISRRLRVFQKYQHCGQQFRRMAKVHLSTVVPQSPSLFGPKESSQVERTPTERELSDTSTEEQPPLVDCIAALLSYL